MPAPQKSLFFLLLCTLAFTNITITKDILIEGKAALFLPQNQIFKNTYGTSGEFGFEFTGEIINHIYGFTSFDFISKSGTTENFSSPTKVYTSSFGVGLKYFIPTNFGDFYLGVGAQPTYLQTTDQSEFVKTLNSRWGCGGIAKVGAIINLPDSFFIDLFIDYSFVHINFTKKFNAPVQSTKAILNGGLFGIGFGYRFN
ncbi:MAG: hypothetical protein ACXWL5_00970 [Candidatus Chromulinivorax sp.]